MIVIGIDIGLTGAVARAGEAPIVRDIPLTTDRRINGRALVHMLRDMVPSNEAAMVVIEDVRPRPNPKRGTSIVTEGSLMRSRGAIEAVVDITGWRLAVVQPQTWKRHFGLLKTEKRASLEKARMLFPGAAADLKRVKDHNRGEALLIAHYGRSVLA